MKFKIHSGEIKRMMKTAIRCVENGRDGRNSNIHIVHRNNLLTVRATNGIFSAEVSTPMMGGDGEGFYVDGAMFKKIVDICGGEIEVSADDKACVVKGAGRTRLPIVSSEIPEFAQVTGKTITVRGEIFRRVWENVKYAVAVDQSRIVLTGVLIESDGQEIRVVALDGFRMAVERFECAGEEIKTVVPGGFMELIAGGVSDDEDIRITFGDGRIQAETDCMVLRSSLLTGDYPDWRRILPTQFKTETIAQTAELREALKNGSVVMAKNNMIRMTIRENEISMESNSDEADYSATVPCETVGEGLTISFNQKYLAEAMNRIQEHECVISFNNSVAPCVIRGHGSDVVNLILPVRTQG